MRKQITSKLEMTKMIIMTKYDYYDSDVSS